MSLTEAPRAVVVDASVAIDFLLGNPRWLERWTEWADEGVMVLTPAHFSAEVANALLRSVKMPGAEVAVQLDRLFRSGVEAADRGLPGLLDAVALADGHGLTVYDALYLQLALDIGGELATLDSDLAKAARTAGVQLA